MSQQLRALTTAKKAFLSIGGPGFLEQRSLLLAAAVALITSVATAPLVSVLAALVWTLANLASFVVLALALTPFWIHRSKSQALKLNPWLVLFLSFAIGAVKAAIVQQLAMLWVGEPVFDPVDLSLSIAVGGLVGLISLPLLSLAVSALGELQQMRQSVAARRIAGGEASSDKTSSLVQGLVETVRAQEADLASRHDAHVSSKELQSFRMLLESQVKPLAKKLWEDNLAGRAGLTVGDLIQLSMAKPVWITPALLPIAIGSVPVYARTLDTAQALLAVALLILTSAGLLYLANCLKSFRSKRPGLWFVTAIAVASLTPWGLITTWIGFSNPQSTLSLIAFSLALGVGALIASAAAFVLEESREIRSTLVELRAQDSRGDSVVRNEARFRANQLHGQIQSRMVATMLRFEGGEPVDRSFLIGELRDIRASLTESPKLEQPTFSQFLVNAQRRWNGFLEIALTQQKDLLPLLDSAQLYPVIEEAISNAHRHGLADRVSIDLRRSGEDAIMTVVDNGVGLRGGPRGLGSEIFSELDPDWQIHTHSNGGSSLTFRVKL